MKTILITGGSRGIGRRIAETFAARGWQVSFTYRNAEEAARELAERTGALAIRADSASESDVLSAVDTATRHMGSIDCLVNNAAIAGFSLFTDITLEAWRHLMDVNLTGAFLYSREVLRGMIARHDGRIINVTSMWGITGSSCEVHYSTAKAALIGLTRALAKEVAPSGITVNAVAPGVIDTDMNRDLDTDAMADLCDRTPVGRIGTPTDVAEAVWFLAQEQASFITGEVLNVNGGFFIG